MSGFIQTIYMRTRFVFQVDELQDLTNDDFKYIGEYDGQESTDYTTWDSRAQGGKKKLRKIDLDPFRLFQQDDPNDSADEESMVNIYLGSPHSTHRVYELFRRHTPFSLNDGDGVFFF